MGAPESWEWRILSKKAEPDAKSHQYDEPVQGSL